MLQRVLIVVLLLSGCSFVVVPASPTPRPVVAAATPVPATVTARPVLPTPPPPTATPVPPTSTPAPPTATPTVVRAEARVLRVLSGDTVEVLLGTVRTTVQYLGVQTPAAAEAAEHFGPEALRRNRQLVEGKTVVLERDVTEKNNLGQLARYVWVGDQLVNATLVREGYARAVESAEDRRYQGLLAYLEGEARGRGAGMWANADRLGQVAPAGTPAAAGPTPIGPGTPTPQVPIFAVTGLRYDLSRERARLVVEFERLLPDLPYQYKIDHQGRMVTIALTRTVGVVDPVTPDDAVVRQISVQPSGVDGVQIRIDLATAASWTYDFGRAPDRLVFDLKPLQ